MTILVPSQEVLIGLLRRICQTPAPTFAETARGELIAELWQQAGAEVSRDSVGNVMAELAGSGPRVLLAAHLDTIFDPDTDVTVKESGGRLCAPGIGDNSASLAIVTALLQALQAAPEAPPRPRLTLAATVGEEGLGDLRGIRQLLSLRPQDFDLMIAVDGHLGTIVHAAVGSKRYEVELSAKGGHSWGDFPSPSAVHALGEAIQALTRLKLPSAPRTTFNVGQVWGGTSINAIAQRAGFNLDLRSLDAGVLASLEAEAVARLRRVAKRHGVELTLRVVGNRPAATVPNEQLVTAAQAALLEVGVTPCLSAGSTDANAAMAVGLPAIAFGVYHGGDAHRLTEWLEPASLRLGYRALWRLLESLAGA
ncbi:MAG: M20/M25/M40 family metallo-hydrolase [Truepera sp.]|nr:M20/M25/M40 family metallo-hydrolase [Truepera sp.]